MAIGRWQRHECEREKMGRMKTAPLATMGIYMPMLATIIVR